MTVVLFIIGVIVLVGCLIAIFFITKSENILSLAYKTQLCENDIDDKLKEKEDLELRVINIINRQIKLDIKIFEEVKNLKVDKLNNYDKDSLLSSSFVEINKIYSDNHELSDVKSFDGLIRDIEKIEVELMGLRTLYNKWASEFNNLYPKFPYKLICKFKKLTIKTLYDGKELRTNDEKELNIEI